MIPQPTSEHDSIAYPLKSITIGTETLMTEGSDTLLYISLDREEKQYNIIDEDGIIQRPGSRFSFASTGLRWVVFSPWSAKITLIPSNGSSYITIEMNNTEAAQELVGEIRRETETELDQTSR